MFVPNVPDLLASHFRRGAGIFKPNRCKFTASAFQDVT
jgi:hypothetical protein